MTKAPDRSRYVRHWKEVFDPENDFVFLKRAKLGGVCGVHDVVPGDPMTKEMAAVLGSHRLKVWWEARFIGTAEYAVAVGMAKQLPRTNMEAVQATGRGWFAVTLPDGSTKKVRGRRAAEELLANV